MKLSLNFVREMERAHGNLYAAAEKILQTPVPRTAAEEELAALLLEILSPLERMGAVEAASPVKRIDVKSLRMFFMGVLGWTPQTMMDEAELEDLADAYEGYVRFHGLGTGTAPPLADFLTEMLKKFPDEKRGRP